MKLAKGAPKKGAIIHGALLLVMLVYGYKVWTRDKSEGTSTAGTVPLWDKAESDLVSIEYATTNRTVKLERRGEGAASYWWGSETKETPATPPAPPTPHPGPMDDPHGAPPRPPGAGSAAAPKPGAGSAAAPKPGAGSAAKPAAGSAAAPKPAAGSAAAPKPAAGSAAGSAAAPKPAAGSAGPAKLAEEPEVVAYQPAGSGAPTTPPPAPAAKRAPTPSAGSGSAAPAAGSAAAPAPAAGSAAPAAPTTSPGPADPATDPVGAAAFGATEPPKTTTREFPTGDGADKVIKGLTVARALRDLGTLDDDQKKEYKLDDTTTTLSVVFKSGTKSLVVGDKVFGGRDRYVLDTDSSKAYVLSGDLIGPFEQGEAGLRLSDPRGFAADAIAKVTVSAKGKARTAARMTSDAASKPDPANPHAPPAGKVKTWGDPATGKPDQTLANFVDNADKLKPTKYEATLDPKSMTEVVVLTYQDAKGATLGTATLYKREKPPEIGGDPTKPPPPPVTEYYVVTEKTRVPGLVPKSAGDRIDQDIATVFAE